MFRLKPWIQIVEPHEDIRKGRFDESIFAADIGEVMSGRGALEYRDPELFFNKTFLTKGLSALVSEVILRFSGKKGAEPVVQLQTPFGGGKTHTLLIIYHLVKNSKNAIKSKGLKEILKKAGIKKIPDVKIAVIDGTALNPSEIRTTVDGVNIKTLWGEIFYQLGGKETYKLLEEDDQNRVAPGTEKIGMIIEKLGPCAILLDETIQYLVKTSGISVGDSTLAGQTLAFIQELSEVISNTKSSMLIASLPSSANELMDESGERAYNKLTKVFGRVEKIKEPVQGEEIYEIVRKRLFDNIPEKDANKAAEVYWDFYQKHKDDFPRNIGEMSYKNLLKRAYPFHPETINVLREKWGTIQDFQRTRGVLRLLALVVADLYKKKDSGYLIHPSDFNLGNSEISAELLKFIGRQFDGVIATDISGPTAKAPQIDNELGSEFAKEGITEGLATAIFIYSFSGKHNEKGVSEPNLRLALTHPDMTFAIFGDALNRAKQRFWYLDVKNGVYKFTGQPNLNKILVEKEDVIKKDDIIDFAQNKLWDMIGEKFPKRYRFPKEDKDIVDVPVLSLVVMGLDYTKGKQTWKDTEKHVLEILNNYGTKHRKYKNSLIFLVADELNYQQLIKNVRRYMALQKIKNEYKTKGLSDEQKGDLNYKLKNAETDMPQSIASTYRHIVLANSKNLKSYDMGAFIFTPSNPISNLVWQTLKDNEKLLEKLDPNLIIGSRWSLWPKTKDMIETKTLWEYFTQYTHLPILADENVLKSTICQGIQRGLFGYGLGDGKKFDTVFFKKYTEETQIDISDTSWLLRPDTALKYLPKDEEKEELKIKESIPEEETKESEEPKEFRDKGVKKLRDIKIEAKLDWQNWDNFYREVIDPLVEENADIEIKLLLIASSKDGIKKDTVDLRIIESLNQRGIKWKFVNES